jgi:uncharacterized membrane protein
MEWRWQAAGGWCRLLLLVRSMGSFRLVVKVALLGALARFGRAALFAASADGRFITGRIVGIKTAHRRVFSAMCISAAPRIILLPGYFYLTALRW